jgi:hypothetical protein
MTYKIASLLLAVALTGCVVVPDQRHYPGGVVMVAPPAPQYEEIGVAPTPGYVYFGGYWRWEGGRHVWTRGHWGPGRPGYHWEGHSWVRYHDGWRLREGHWVRG